MVTHFAAMKPLRPSLYRLAPDGRSLDFLFVQCSVCGGLTFPANAPGCMHCGDALEGAKQVVRPGGGSLLEYVTIHVPLAPGSAAPSIAGDIRIEDGIVEEGVIAVEDESSLRLGMKLKAVAVEALSGETYTCRFVPAEEQESP